MRRFSVDRAYLRERVLGFIDLDNDALEQVEQIRRGECVEIDPAARPTLRSRRFYWDPFTFLQPRSVIEDPTHAAASMRATVRSCTQTLSAGHASLLHQTVGRTGFLDHCRLSRSRFDAAADRVLHVLQSAGSFGRAALGAPRGRAQRASSISSARSLPPKYDFADLVRARPATEPLSLLSYMMRSTLDHRLAANARVTALFTGDGGDSGFCSDSFPYAVTDYLRRHGPRLAALRLASEVALRTERSTAPCC